MILLSLGIGLLLSIGSCRKSGLRCGSLGFAFALQDEAQNLSNASSAYSQNPTPANCEAYKHAYLDYIDAIRGYEKCLTTQAERASWQQSLEDSEQNAMNIQC